MKTTMTITAVLALGLPCIPAHAQFPSHIPLQGYLQNADGTPVDGSARFTVALYDTPTGGTPLYTEVQSVSVDRGRFSLPIGRAAPFPWSELGQNPRLYFGLSVDDDAELQPRLELGAVPYASRAFSAQNLRGAAPEDFAPVDHAHAWGEIAGVPSGLEDGDDDTLGSLSCAPGEVAKAAAGGWSCSGDLVGLSTVGPGDIATGAVTGRALADRAVTTSKLGDGVVTGRKVQDRSLTGQDLAFASVTNRQIAANTLTANELAPNSVSTSELAAGSVTGPKLSLNSSEYCVTGPNGPSALRVVPGRRFCAMSRVPSNVRCEIDNVNSEFRLIEAPSGPDNCCMRCF